MSELNNAVIGTHNFQTFTKTITTSAGYETYSDGAKRAIVVQLCTLLRDPLYNSSKARNALGKIHNVHPDSILNWYKKFGTNLSTPVKPIKSKPDAYKVKIDPNNPKITDGFSVTKPKLIQTSNVDSIASIINKTSPSTIDKLANLLKLIPSVEISISIKPSK